VEEGVLRIVQCGVGKERRPTWAGILSPPRITWEVRSDKPEPL
jgi:hypothetical protein